MEVNDIIYHEIITELNNLNETPQTIIAQYERIEFGQSCTNDETLLNCNFTKIFHKLNQNHTLRPYLKLISTNPSELIEWFILYSYVLGND